VINLLTPSRTRYTSARALLGRAKTRVTAVVAEFHTSVAQPVTQPEPADEFTPDELPAVELIEAAAREFDRAADQARRADRGKRAACKILDRLPAGTYGSWLVERVPSARQTADLDAIRAILPGGRAVHATARGCAGAGRQHLHLRRPEGRHPRRGTVGRRCLVLRHLHPGRRRPAAPRGRSGAVMNIRLIGTPEEVDLALIRLRQAFSEVRAEAPRPSHSQPGLCPLLPLAFRPRARAQGKGRGQNFAVA
jgi:hypothetical protein